MTDNEIIKVLECCRHISCVDGCPLDGEIDCGTKLVVNALDLIQRQQERIDRIVEQLEELAEDARIEDYCPDSKYRDGCIENCQLCYVFASIKIVKGVQNE